MPAQLVALTDGPSILLDKPILLLGRHPECDIQIESRKVSRRHCCIAQVHDYLVVRDLGSTNGIRINGVRVVEGQIKSGDELTIGSLRFQVQLDAGDARAPGGAKRPKPVVKPVPFDDDQLESCDEPIPLAEPGGAPHPAVPILLTPEPESPPPSPLLPDQLELAPSSKPVPAPSSPAHQPS
ncbi:MAG TPA: FHA domain-containing protein [Gemmataceae bacterium]|nr:FHA domain-containing protein [Gemmataceae bacterium]